MRNIALMLVGSLGAIALGLPYVHISSYRALGPGEVEFYDLVLLWGRVSLYTGIVLTMLSLAVGPRRGKPYKVILALGYSVLMLLQLPPIYCWFGLHGYGIADRPGSFVAHWGYAIPHIILLAVGAFVLYGVLRARAPGSHSPHGALD
jgi:hypothetical protein